MKIGSIYLAVQPKTPSICLPSQLTVWAPETMATLVYSTHKLWLLVEVSLLFMGGYKSTWPTHWGTNLYNKPSTHHHFLMISPCVCLRKKTCLMANPPKKTVLYQFDGFYIVISWFIPFPKTWMADYEKKHRKPPGLDPSTFWIQMWINAVVNVWGKPSGKLTVCY